ASSSPRRKKILEDLKVEFEIIPANINEDVVDKRNPFIYVQEIARMKAERVANILKEKNAVIVAADTIVLIDDELLGKVHNKEDMKKILEKLRGKSHKVLTGISIIDTENGRILQDYEESEVRFRNLTEETINNYINSMSWQNKAGGYNIEEVEEKFVEEIKGDYYNILGLPVKKLNYLLSKLGLSLEYFMEKK
ncbi:MAG: nucleoside triphosphate pyrophosphatase, partial [candidate division WOR-3 bacterium]